MNKRTKLVLKLAVPGVVLFFGAIFLFAPDYQRAESPTPAYALADSDLLPLGATHIQALVALRLSRSNLSPNTVKGLGALIWLPMLIGYFTFLILMFLYERLEADILWPAGLTFVGVLLIWALGWIQIGGLIILVAVAAPLLGAWRSGKLRHWLLGAHIAIATLLFFSAFALSLSTHLLLARYNGLRPASQVDPRELRTLFDTFTHGSVPGGVSDVTSWQVSKIPGLNSVTKPPMTLFAVNRLAAAAFIGAAIAYLLAVSVIIIPAVQREPEGQRVPPDPTNSHERRGARIRAHITRSLLLPHSQRTNRQVPHAARVVFALLFYLSVGVAFAITYFNIYIAAAGKQNVMLLYADFMESGDDRYNQLVVAQDSFGPTESLVQRMRTAAQERPDGDIRATLYAARARYWPSAVIAQELPRVIGSEATAETQMMLDPQITFTDMLYFSFISFTTTGYGDIRPISDELRFWTVCENITEVLFTAMFFVVAMKPPERPRRRFRISRALQGVALCATIALMAQPALATELERSDQLLSFFGCSPPRLADLPPVDVLIDTSRSMKGFVHAENGGRYRKVLDRILERIGDKVTIRRLTAPNGEPIRPVRAVYKPDLYVDDITPLDRAFRFARESPQRITVLISDLEHSTKDGDLRDAERAIVVALSIKKNALVIGIKSPYINQESPACSPNCHAQGRRNLYVLIMASSPGLLRLLVDTTEIDGFANDDPDAAKNGSPIYYSDRSAAEVDDITLFGDPDRGAWREFRYPGRVRCADSALDRLQASFSYRDQWPKEPLRLLVTFVVRDPIQNFSWTAPRIERVERPSSRLRQAVKTHVVRHFADGEAFAEGGKPKSIRVEYNFTKPGIQKWDVYRVWFESNPANMAIPKWVAKWNEQVPASEDATPAVAALVRMMIREVTQKQVLLEHFIAIGPG